MNCMPPVRVVTAPNTKAARQGVAMTGVRAGLKVWMNDDFFCLFLNRY